METGKPVHTVVLDTGAIIRNQPTVSTLLAQSERIVTVPAIVSEIRDAATRSRVETTLQPFLTLRTPGPASIKFVTEFARRTGDLAVLSKPDIQIIALAYELECERNGGDWRLRKAPGQKGLNGAPPSKDAKTEEKPASETAQPAEAGANGMEQAAPTDAGLVNKDLATPTEPVIQAGAEQPAQEEVQAEVPEATPSADAQGRNFKPSRSKLSSNLYRMQKEAEAAPKVDSALNSQEDANSTDSDSEGWITPSNLKKHQAKDVGTSTTQTTEPKTMQVATLTTDFAMQNVILQINLNLLSPSMNRVKHLKTFILRCHACFQTTKEMNKQFCPRCGKPTLTRVACSTDANGQFTLHLKKNMQWNTRGDRYSIPKPVAGSANGRVKGGGKEGWGNDLILAEDQKEYVRTLGQQKRTKERDLMDEDYLPSILTGDRGRAGGRIKVGAGKNVNSRKR
ncbi:20S-pre-rRNA D-site endonuclease nob1 [Taxawa tesnikishii (nom. ined.)]|nr:20S-pre-rRNA D-site endonuclease nob1 [Dothideales sp. JES 119]